MRSAVDLVYGNRPVTCNPVSGSILPIATTSVACSADDGHGNASIKSFIIQVRDTTRPALVLPPSVTANATTPTGAVVSYTANATDPVDGSCPIACSPASGSFFPIGTSMVTCTAADTRGNSKSGSFTVKVLDGSEQPITLQITIASGPGSNETKAKLASGLRVANYYFARGDKPPGCQNLATFISDVQTFKASGQLTAVAADSYIADANRIRSVSGC